MYRKPNSISITSPLIPDPETRRLLLKPQLRQPPFEASWQLIDHIRVLHPLPQKQLTPNYIPVAPEIKIPNMLLLKSKTSRTS